MYRIMRAVRRMLVVSAVATLLSGLAVSVARADEAAPAPPDTKTVQALQLLDQGVKLNRIGEYQKAGAALDQILALQPDPPLALLLREKAGLDQLTGMFAHNETEAQAYKLLLLSQQEVRRLRMDTEHIQALINDFISDDIAKRIRAEAELVAAGEYAVPYLLMVMDVEQESVFGWTREERILARAYAYRALDDMGVRAVMPLIEALRCDNIGLKVQICRMLQKAGDARAIPALEAAAQDTTQPARMTEAAYAAAAALSEKAGLPVNRPAAQSYLALAESYYYSDPRIIDYVPGLERAIWAWDPDGKTYAEHITYRTAPQYAYNEWMTEKLVCDGLGIGSDAKGLEAYLAKTPRLPAGDVRRELLASLIANRYSEIAEDRALAAGQPVVGKAEAPAEVKAEAAQRADELDASRPTLRLIGSPEFHDALLRFLKDGDYAQAGNCIEDLRILADSTVPEPEDALLKAIYAPVPGVRYSATETLLEIAPDGGMGGQIQVVANVIAICSSNTTPGVAVITQDDNLYATVANAVGRSGCHAQRLATVADVIRHASTELPFVAMVVIDTRTQEQPAAAVAELKQNIATGLLPVILLAPQDVSSANQEAGRKASQVLSLDAGEAQLADALTRVMTAAAPPEEQTTAAHQRLLDTLDAISKLPAMTLYPVSACAPAITALLALPDAEVAMRAVKALSAIASPVAFAPLVTIFLDERDAADLRMAAGNAAATIMLVSNEKQPLRLSDDQRNAALALAEKPETSPEMRALATRLFTIVPAGRKG